MSSRPAKRARYVEEPAFIEVSGESRPYVPINITKAREAYAASLDVIFKHVADFHVTIIQIISEKYKIDEDEILGTIKGDPRYTGMYEDPRLNPLGYFKAADAAATAGGVAAPTPADDGVVFEESDAEMGAVTAKVAAMKISMPYRMCGFPCAGDCMSCDLHEKIHGKGTSIIQQPTFAAPTAAAVTATVKKKVTVRRPKKTVSAAAASTASGGQ